jgi:CO dehydrogenase nickel-insertion accessory protein CooC1
MKTIMTAGKGGTGKSIMLSNLLTQHILLQPNSSQTLIVDADPHQSLTDLLARCYRFKIPTSLGDLRRQYADTLRSGKGLEQASRSELASLILQRALVRLPGGAALLVMGANEQTGCQCVVNSLLGNALDALRDGFDLAVVDNEAGIEQIGRHGWPVDILLLMTTLRATDLDITKRILLHAQAVQREIRYSTLIINHFDASYAGALHHKRFPLPETDSIVTLPYSESLEIAETPNTEWLSNLKVLWQVIKEQKDNAHVPAMVSRYQTDYSQ